MFTRMCNVLLVVFNSLCIIACRPSNSPPNPTTTIIINPSPTVSEQDGGVNNEITKRHDLPENWIEVTNNNWSYGLPSDFSETHPLPMSAQAQHHSQKTGLNVSLTTYQSSHATVKHWLAANYDKFITQTKTLFDMRETVINAHTVVGIYSAELLDQNPDSFLDFVLQHDNTVFHLSCYARTDAFLLHHQLCFDIVETLRVR